MKRVLNQGVGYLLFAPALDLLLWFCALRRFSVKVCSEGVLLDLVFHCWFGFRWKVESGRSDASVSNA